MESSSLNSTQRYAGCALFALALNQSQNPQFRLSTSPSSPDRDPDHASDCPSRIWIHEHSGLIFPIFKFTGVDDKEWKDLIEIGGSVQFSDHLNTFLKVFSGECVNSADPGVRESVNSANQVDEGKILSSVIEQSVSSESDLQNVKDLIQEGLSSASYKIKVTVLYEILSACLLSNKEGDSSCSKPRNGYDSRHRVALRLLATWLDVEWVKMEALELTVACYLLDTEKSKASKREDGARSKWRHGAIIGGAALAGGTVLALTGGLAAPAIAQGIGALTPAVHALVPAIGATGLSAAVTALGSFGGSVAVAASFGAAGAGLTGKKVAKRLGGIEEFEFKAIGENHNQGRLAVGVLVPGIVFDEEDFVNPWHGRMDNLERYTLRWDSQNLIAFSEAIRDWVSSTIKTQALQWGAMLTVLQALVVAVAIPASLVTAMQVIDSHWAIAVDRSDKAGKLLAETLLEGLHGNRPVTLIGYSAGARVIFKCLQCLAEKEEANAGLVERVVLLGAPVSINEEEWVLARKMVAGRFVNAYSKNDWTLGIAFRAQLRVRGLAGIQSVDTHGIENVDVTDVVESHISYLRCTEQILEQLELDSCEPVSEDMFKKPEEPSQDSDNSTSTS